MNQRSQSRSSTAFARSPRQGFDPSSHPAGVAGGFYDDGYEFRDAIDMEVAGQYRRCGEHAGRSRSARPGRCLAACPHPGQPAFPSAPPKGLAVPTGHGHETSACRPAQTRSASPSPFKSTAGVRTCGPALKAAQPPCGLPRCGWPPEPPLPRRLAEQLGPRTSASCTDQRIVPCFMSQQLASPRRSTLRPRLSRRP